MASFVYNEFKHVIMEKTMDLSNGGDTIKVALMATAHSGSDKDDNGWSSVSTNEVTSTVGYTAGGATLANQATSVDDTNDYGKFTADDVTWSSSTITAYYAVIYDDTVATPAKPLIASIDFSGAKSSNNGNFTIEWDDTDGILNIT